MLAGIKYRLKIRKIFRSGCLPASFLYLLRQTHAALQNEIYLLVADASFLLPISPALPYVK